MKLFSQRAAIQGVADRWRDQYGPFTDDSGKYFWDKRDRIETYNQLVALDKTKATPEDVAAIIGNRSWTTFRCDECKCETDALVQIGEPVDYESNTASICRECIEKALTSISQT